MLNMRGLTYIALLILLDVIPRALTHGHDGHRGTATDMGSLKVSHLSSSLNSTGGSSQSYFAYPKHGGFMLAHSGLMIVAWVFILPIGECVLRDMAICVADHMTISRANAEHRSIPACSPCPILILRGAQRCVVARGPLQKQDSKSIQEQCPQ